MGNLDLQSLILQSALPPKRVDKEKKKSSVRKRQKAFSHLKIYFQRHAGLITEEMRKLTKIGVTTPRHQIQNTFQVRNFFLTSKINLNPSTPSLFPQRIENYWYKLTKGSSLTQLAFFNLQYIKHQNQLHKQEQHLYLNLR